MNARRVQSSTNRRTGNMCSRMDSSTDSRTDSITVEGTLRRSGQAVGRRRSCSSKVSTKNWGLDTRESNNNSDRKSKKPERMMRNEYRKRFDIFGKILQ